MPDIKLIAAVDDKNGIAAKQKIPWDLPSDRQYFRDKLKDGPVVSGWKTYAANNFKPYGQGENIVLTRRDLEAAPGVWIVHSAEEYFKNLKKDVWVSGGGEIFKIALPYATHLYITKVEGDFGTDTFFPDYKNDFKLVDEKPPMTENGITFRYQIWERK
jgi:dihydrofolate reductase